jgi:hypothetical protein
LREEGLRTHRGGEAQAADHRAAGQTPQAGPEEQVREREESVAVVVVELEDARLVDRVARLRVPVRLIELAEGLFVGALEVELPVLGYSLMIPKAISSPFSGLREIPARQIASIALGLGGAPGESGYHFNLYPPAITAKGDLVINRLSQRAKINGLRAMTCEPRHKPSKKRSAAYPSCD